jgi:hypothetical protein
MRAIALLLALSLAIANTGSVVGASEQKVKNKYLSKVYPCSPLKYLYYILEFILTSNLSINAVLSG